MQYLKFVAATAAILTALVLASMAGRALAQSEPSPPPDR